MEETKDHYKFREPWVVQDPDFKREWLSAEPITHYLHKDKNNEWMVINRRLDIAATRCHKTREAAIREFYKSVNRKIPTGTKLKKFPDSQYAG